MKGATRFAGGEVFVELRAFLGRELVVHRGSQPALGVVVNVVDGCHMVRRQQRWRAALRLGSARF